MTINKKNNKPKIIKLMIINYYKLICMLKFYSLLLNFIVKKKKINNVYIKVTDHNHIAYLNRKIFYREIRIVNSLDRIEFTITL